jgi:hypothetical protein
LGGELTFYKELVNIHSKSPESETTTVPVCLRRSRDVVMMVVKNRVICGLGYDLLIDYMMSYT